MQGCSADTSPSTHYTRCTGCSWALASWVSEMSIYLKSIDPMHLVSVGAEGFYSSTCERVWLNPGAGKRRTGIASAPWAMQVRAGGVHAQLGTGGGGWG